MKTVLIINECFSDNLGDQAIAEGAAVMFESFGYSVVREGFSSRNKLKNFNQNKNQSNYIKNWVRKRLVLKSIYWLLKNLTRVISSAYTCQKLAVIGGGQLILSNSSFAIAMLSWVVFLKLFRKEVVLLSVGVGDSFGAFEKLLYKISFYLADDIYSRDKQGVLTLKDTFGISGKFSPDLAYALPRYERLSNSSTFYAAICITDYAVHVRYAPELDVPILSRQEYWLTWAKHVEEYKALGYEIKFLWTTDTDRFETIEYLANCMPDSEYVIPCEELTLGAFIKELSMCDVVVSGRMHALILGNINGCEVKSWEVSNKIKTFCKEYLSEDVTVLRHRTRGIVDNLISRDYSAAR
jgi:polysaccharide pyruvyl transferase WcaK-like protein